jgi:predicted membrane protein
MKHDIPDLDKKGLREFGLVTAAIVVVLFGGLLPWLFGFNFPTWPWIFAAILGLWALVAPNSLNQPYRLWMRFGMLIGAVMNRVVLAAVFFIVVMPMGVVMRLFGKDPMQRKLDDNQESYRVESTPTSAERMDRPF